MRCDKARERFQDYIEGTLKGKDLRSFEEHLRSCHDCSQELDSVKELDARLRQEAPGIWESIEPAPDFLARLKRMELEPAPGKSSRIVEALSGLWFEHRMALATGVSICIVIALFITLPIELPEFGSREAIKEVIKEVPVEKMIVKEVPMQVAEEGTPEAAVMPDASRSFGVTDYTADQVDQAITIARNDSKVQEFTEDAELPIVKVFNATAEEDFICLGLTVVIALDEAEPPQTLLYVCVDLDKQQVTGIKFFPERESGP